MCRQQKRRRSGAAADEPTAKRVRELSSEEKQAVGRALLALSDVAEAGVVVDELLKTVQAEHSGLSLEQLQALLEQHSNHPTGLPELPPAFYDPEGRTVMLV